MENKLKALLQPYKEGKSYPQIAQRCNQWLKENNRDVASVSSEAIRKIYRGDVVRPGRVYLDAIAATQDVSLDKLLDAAGYPPDDNQTFEERLRKVLEGVKASGVENPKTDAEIIDITRSILREFAEQ